MTGLLAPVRGVPYNLDADDSPTPNTGYGVLVTASGTAHVKGSWVAVHSSIAHDLYWHLITFTAVGASATNTQMLVDLGVGPDSSNVSVIAENLIAGSAGNFGNSVLGGWRDYWLPLFVPAGTQLWARCQALVVSDTVRVNVNSFGGTFPGCPIVTYIESIGEDLANSVGTSFTPGASGAMGSYAEMVASTGNRYLGLTASWASTDGGMQNTGILLELGLGAATEEDLGNVCQGWSGTQEGVGHLAWPVFQQVPAGSRIALRGTQPTAVDTGMTAIVYGLMGVAA